MPEPTDYNSIADAIDRAEGAAHAMGIVLDLKDALASQVDIEPYDYNSACKRIGSMESALSAEQQAAAQKVQIVIPGEQQVAQRAAQIRTKIKGAEMEKKLVGLNKEVLGAAAQIGKIVGATGKGIAAQVSQGIESAKLKKLVLPNLSLTDQIHELEGIGEGLAQRAFDGTQLQIIKSEIAGLEEKAAKEGVAGEGPQ
ncbi:MAG: hypothetical protein KGH49_02595, partial [Candidatus Micrarchaeota archaeon]|nr:hypothetical protein [Candidatus Micrarchaeota archaeon]